MATRLRRDKGVICWAAAPPRTKPDPINNIWTETAEFQTMMLLNFSTVSSHAIEPARLVGNGNDCEYCRYKSTIITRPVHCSVFSIMPYIIEYNQRWWPEMPLKNCSISTYVWKLKWIFFKAIFCVKYSVDYSLGLEIFCLNYSMYYNLSLRYKAKIVTMSMIEYVQWKWDTECWWCWLQTARYGPWWHQQPVKNLFSDPGLHLSAQIKTQLIEIFLSNAKMM